MPIPAEPVVYIATGLFAIAVMVLVLPFKVRRIEENLEPFFLFMGVLAVTVSGLWSIELIINALKAPVVIGPLPVGIFQIVLLFGILLHYFKKPFYSLVNSLACRLSPRVFIFLLILLLGLLSSVISVILSAFLLVEIVASLPLSKEDKIRLVVVSCFALALGACLTPVGEPLSTILVMKLAGPPYHASFLFPLQVFGIYMIPGVFALAVFGSLWLGPKLPLGKKEVEIRYPETLRKVVFRALKVYVFVAALILLGEGFRPLIIWYFSGLSPSLLYWFNSVSAVFDNATLTAIEINPALSLPQIINIIMGLSIAGGMLISGNIPNIVASGRLKITMKEWAKTGVPLGLAIMAIYFLILFLLPPLVLL
jgi:predicted cation transporter